MITFSYICFCHLMISIQGTLTAIRDWFRDYKIPDGKPANRFGLGNKPTSKVTWTQLLCLAWSAEIILAILWHPFLSEAGICSEGHWGNQRIMGEIGEEEYPCWRALTSLILNPWEATTFFEPCFSWWCRFVCCNSVSVFLHFADVFANCVTGIILSGE